MSIPLIYGLLKQINGATNQLGYNVRSEEIYKLAVSEMMVWLSE
jgi:hypothetical protein